MTLNTGCLGRFMNMMALITGRRSAWIQVRRGMGVRYYLVCFIRQFPLVSVTGQTYFIGDLLLGRIFLMAVGTLEPLGLVRIAQ